MQAEQGSLKHYPDRLYHRVPGWVPLGSVFHIRIRTTPDQRPPLTDPTLAQTILESIQGYVEKDLWFAHLVLLMPDHLHGLLSFNPEKGMSRVVGEWKKLHRRVNGIRWQENFFDHRIRSDEERVEKAAYVRRNPVVKGLCSREEDWPWVVDASAWPAMVRQPVDAAVPTGVRSQTETAVGTPRST